MIITQKFFTIYIISLILLLSTTTFGQVIENLVWPIDRKLHDGLFLMMLVDNNHSAGSAQEYMCGSQFVYDGHRGTDITTLNFKLMDQGVAVLAATDGVVSFTRHDQFDRNYWPPYIGDPNGVVIQHADGSNTQYWHLRQNSISVEVGEFVHTGQVIAMIGSSGATPIPHLHFEVWDNSSGTLQFRDPFSGPCNTLPSLWIENYEYPGSLNVRILDADVFTKTNLLGNEGNNYFGEKSLKDRPFRPLVYGAHQDKLGLWIQLQGLFSTQYQVEILRWDGSSFSNITKTISTSKGVQWHVFYWNFNGQVVPEDFGWWRAIISYNGEVLKQVEFEVGDSTRFGPRFFPLSGRSFYVDGTVWQDTLRLSGLEAWPFTFSLQNAPTSVILTDSVVTIGAISNQPYRNHIFTVIAQDNLGHSDTMYYHLIDFSKPVNPITSIKTDNSIHYSSLFQLNQNYPNPFNPHTIISYSLPQTSDISLTIYNILGRKIRTLIEESNQAAGIHTARWNGRDDTGKQVASGIYIYRMQAGGRNEIKKMTLIR